MNSLTTMAPDQFRPNELEIRQVNGNVKVHADPVPRLAEGFRLAAGGVKLPNPCGRPRMNTS